MKKKLGVNLSREGVPPIPQPVGLTGLNPTGFSSVGTGRPAMEATHQPVLLKEVLEFLRVAPGKRYIDATLGMGGHAAAVVRKGGVVLGIEQDIQELEITKERFAADLKFKIENLKIAKGNFRNLGKLARENGFTQVDGVLFDLGMSSWQLEYSGRGFSFQKDEPLDMRMDPSLQVTAADLVNGLYEKELVQLFRKFGEDPWSRRHAHALVRERERRPVETAPQLAALIAAVSPPPVGGVGNWRRHPATRVFQALRIAVNDELGNLEKALPQALELIKPGGRLVVISFHSLEDRLVKRFFSSQSGLAVSDLPCRFPNPSGWRNQTRRVFPRQGDTAAAVTTRLRILTPKPVTPSGEELTRNPRARSAKLRAAEKLGGKNENC